MLRYLIPLVAFILFLSCKNNTNKELTPTSKAPDKIVQSMDNPSEENSQLPRLFSNGNELYFSWVTRKDSIDILNFSILYPEEWGEVTEVISGNDWFTNWADFPAIAENNGNILTSFLQKSADGTYTYDIKLNLYNAAKNEWKKDFILNDDGTQSEHGFVSIRPYAGNSFMVSWLDGRETVGKGHGGGQMTLRGALVFEDGSIDYDTLLDEKVCDCCQTATAIGPNDEIIVAYRDRNDDEVRDISVVNWTMESGWSKPSTVGNDQWKIAGCPVNGPSLDSYENAAAVAWFTAAEDKAMVKVAFSEDSGKTFGLPFRMDEGDAIGRVDVAMLDADTAVVCWLENKGEDTLIMLQKIMTDGTKGNPVVLSKTSSERSSGFPQIEYLNWTIFAAWTMVEEQGTHIEMASISIEDL